MQRMFLISILLPLLFSIFSFAQSEGLKKDDLAKLCDPYELFSNKICEPFSSSKSNVDKDRVAAEMDLKNILYNSRNLFSSLIYSDPTAEAAFTTEDSSTQGQDIFKNYLKSLFPALYQNNEGKQIQVVNFFDSGPWQKALNILLENIFLNENVNKNYLENFLCKSIPPFSQQFSLTRGITDQVVGKKIYNHCPKNTITFSNGNLYMTKIYVLVKIDYDSFPYSGWTSESNITFLFIKKNTTWSDLAAALIHEFAVIMDSKTSYNHFDLNNSDEKRKLILSTQCTAIKSALITLRANKLMMEGISKSNNPTQDPRKKDAENFISLVNLYSKWENNPNKIIRIGEHTLECSNLDEIVKNILNPEIKIQTTQGETDFFNYLATPEIALKSIENHGAHGPGCGYCGGSNKPEDIDREWGNKMRNSQE